VCVYVLSSNETLFLKWRSHNEIVVVNCIAIRASVNEMVLFGQFIINDKFFGLKKGGGSDLLDPRGSGPPWIRL
jgi:hypothetical protein